MYDNICKFLIEQFPLDFATWLLGEPIPLIELSPKELSSEPIRADALLLQAENTILHVEFQTRPDPGIPFRMLDYCTRIYRRFPNRAQKQIVIYLKQTQSADVYKTTFERSRTRHEFDVIRIWEQPYTDLLSSPGLLPLAILGATQDRVATLSQISRTIEQTEDVDVQKNLAAATNILAGLVLSKEVVSAILRTELMKESVTYQAIKAEGRAEGREEGAHLIATQMLTLKFGEIPDEVVGSVNQIPLAQLPAFVVAAQRFESFSDVTDWIEAQVPQTE